MSAPSVYCLQGLALVGTQDILGQKLMKRIDSRAVVKIS